MFVCDVWRYIQLHEVIYTVEDDGFSSLSLFSFHGANEIPTTTSPLSVYVLHVHWVDVGCRLFLAMPKPPLSSYSIIIWFQSSWLYISFLCFLGAAGCAWSVKLIMSRTTFGSRSCLLWCRSSALTLFSICCHQNAATAHRFLNRWAKGTSALLYISFSVSGRDRGRPCPCFFLFFLLLGCIWFFVVIVTFFG